MNGKQGKIVIIKIPKAMEDIPGCREGKEREMRPKWEINDGKMSKKAK